MRYVRRFIATITAITIWCIATTTTAYARIPDPIYDRVPVVPSSTTSVASVDTPLWKFALVAAIAVLLTVAVVGLFASLRQTRTAGPSPMSPA